jgi:hypothetical protein
MDKYLESVISKICYNCNELCIYRFFARERTKYPDECPYQLEHIVLEQKGIK